MLRLALTIGANAGFRLSPFRFGKQAKNTAWNTRKQARATAKNITSVFPPTNNSPRLESAILLCFLSFDV